MKVKQHYLKAGLVLSSLLRSSRSKFPLVLAITALMMTATCLRADSDGNQSEQLAGTWVSAPQPGNLSALVSYMADGRAIFSRSIIVAPPSGVELVSTGHGEWIRTGHNEFTSTVLFIRSGPAVEFTGFVKLTSTIKLDHNSDQITVTSTTYIFGAGGNLLFSFPGVPAVFTRIVAGQ